MPVIHFDQRRIRYTPDAQRVAGPGFAIYQNAPTDPERLLHVDEWTAEVEALYSGGGPVRVALKGVHAPEALRQLSRHAALVRSLSIESAEKFDGSLLGKFSALERLALTCQAIDVPFGELTALRTCEINSPMTLGAIADAPWIEDLGLERLKLRNLEGLAPLQRLRRLRLTQLKSLESLAGLERLQLEELHLIQATKLASLAAIRALPLRVLEIIGSKAASDPEVAGEIVSLETLKIDAGPAPDSFEFLRSLTKLECLHFINTPTKNAVSFTPLDNLKHLRELMVGGEKPLVMKDIEVIGRLLAIETIDLSQGPKEIASIEFLRPLRRLRGFRLSGTTIGDGDISVLLALPDLEYVFLSPAKRHYSLTTESLAVEMARRARNG